MTLPTFHVGGSTAIGVHPNRPSNDDFLLLDQDLGLFAVLDAGGNWAEIGGRAGAVGAAVVRRVIREGRGAEPHDLIGRAFRAAGDALRAEPDEMGWCGGCSVALALFHGDRLHVAWLGDARAHRVTGDRVELLTQPHTAWNECLRRGTTPPNPSLQRVLVYSLGGSELPDPLDVISFVPQPGDRLVLATDGVAGLISSDTILNACRQIADPTTCAEAIIDHAIAAGSRDNCTCAVIAFE